MFYVRCIDEKSDVKPEKKPRERPEWENEYGPVTFYELMKDYDHSTLKFSSYISGDTVIVKDRISRAEIQKNHSVFHNRKDYDYSVDIWLDSMNELNEYNEKPTLLVVGDNNITTMKSNFQVGDNITVHFAISSSILHSEKGDSGNGDNSSTRFGPSGTAILINPTGIKVLDVNCTINDDRTEVEEIQIKGGVYASSPDYDLYQGTVIKVYWKKSDPAVSKRGKIFLQHQNNSCYYHDGLNCVKIETHIGVDVYETIFDHIEKTIPTDVDSFWHENKRDMKPTSSEGIITPGDVVNIIFNFTQLHQPPNGDSLGPGSFVKIIIDTHRGVPTLEEFYIPDTFPEEEKYVHLSPLEE